MLSVPSLKSKLTADYPKRVLWLSSLNLGAYLHQKSKMEIMGSLANRGYTSTLIAIRSTNPVQTAHSQVRFVSIPLKSIPIVTPVLYAIALFFFLPWHILTSKPDYIITDPYISVFSLSSVIPLSRLLGIKMILDIRSVPVETSDFRHSLQSPLFTTSITFANRLFDGMTMITHLMREEVCRRFSIDPERVGVWSSGVSTKLFNPDDHTPESVHLRKRLGLNEKFVVCYHGVFSANRGLAETIEAMSIVKKVSYNVIFLLLGTGPSVRSLRNLIKSKGLQDTVIIHSSVEHEEVPKYIAVCNVGIVPLPDHPYWRTQSPLKLLEYLAMKKVVIVTSIPAHRAVVQNDVCGIYISSINPVEIAESIIYAYNNREKLEAWGASGRKLVEEEYTWEKIAENLESYLLSINNVFHHTHTIRSRPQQRSKLHKLRG